VQPSSENDIFDGGGRPVGKHVFYDTTDALCGNAFTGA
jgi:hypothetical protein